MLSGMLARIGRLRGENGLELWVRRTRWIMLGLAAAFLVVLAIPLAFPDLPSGVQQVINWLDVAIWMAFVIDYGVRFYLAPHRAEFFRKHLIDLIIVAAPPLTFLRGLLLLRLLRVFSLFVVADRRLRKTRALHGRVAMYTTAVTLLVIVFSALAIYSAERGRQGANIEDLGDAFWWALVTVTTVGYGDAYPTTVAGRLVAGALMITGIGVLGVVTASIASWFVKRLGEMQAAEQRTQASMDDVVERLDMLHRQNELLRTEVAELRGRIEAGVPSPAPGPPTPR